MNKKFELQNSFILLSRNITFTWMDARVMIMCGNKTFSCSELSWLKIGKSSVDSSMQSRQTLSTFIIGDIIIQWRECMIAFETKFPIWNLFYGATVISISDNHIHVCECPIHFQISAKKFSPKYFSLTKSTITHKATWIYETPGTSRHLSLYFCHCFLDAPV